ncbi:prolyl 4-hydroxylase subunit alpha-2-like isoform X2 [Tachypleus tridentatus]
MKILSAVLAVLLAVPAAVSTEYFSATTSLINLLQSEQAVVNVLQDYVSGIEKHIEVIKEFINNRRPVGEKVDEMTDYISNPIQAYTLIKRMTIDLKAVEASTQVMATPDYVPDISQLRSAFYLPQESDLNGAANALILLQETYKLNMSAMVRGLLQSNGPISPFQADEQLTARDCLYLGKNSFNQGYFDNAIDWFKIALTKAKDEHNITVTQEEIQTFLDIAVYSYDEIMKERKGVNWETSLLGANYEEKFTPEFFDDNIHPTRENEQFNRLCRGEQLRPPKWDKNLRCRYFKGYHPYLLLQPIKLEERSRKPYIVQLYDVISDKEIQKIQNLSKPYLQRSTHYSNNGNYVASLKRTSANTWLTEDQNPLAKRLDNRLKMITGLASRYKNYAAEAYQIANYGIGGHYVPHQDYMQSIRDNPFQLSEFEARAGDRIATWMFYLSDVEAGGATAFPYVGAVVWPKKGSAVFWWNLKRNSEGDIMTFHGACPVLRGSKWVCNKWFRVNAQMFRKPCSLNEDAYFTDL